MNLESLINPNFISSAISPIYLNHYAHARTRDRCIELGRLYGREDQASRFSHHVALWTRDTRNRNTERCTVTMYHYAARLARYGQRDLANVGFSIGNRLARASFQRVRENGFWCPGDTFTCTLPMSDRAQACGPRAELALQFRSTGQERTQFARQSTDNPIPADRTIDPLPTGYVAARERGEIARRN